MVKTTGRKQSARAKPKKKEAPTKPLSGYVLWLKANRPSIAEPGMKPAEVMRAAAKAWKKLADKSEWLDKAAEMKASFKAAQEAEDAAEAGAAGEASKKEQPQPKKKFSAYSTFLKENRAAFAKPGMSQPDVMRAAAEAWNKLEDKSEWKEKAADEKERQANGGEVVEQTSCPWWQDPRCLKKTADTD